MLFMDNPTESHNRNVIFIQSSPILSEHSTEYQVHILFVNLRYPASKEITKVDLIICFQNVLQSRD